MDATSVDENKDSIELQQSSAGAATYDNLNRRSVTPQELYECLKPERKNVECLKMDKMVDRKFVLILLSIVVIALVVAFIVVAVIIYAVVRGNDSVVAKEILFSARGLTNLSPPQGETLVFKTTITNKGSGYDNRTGIFTVPVRGMFMFSVQLCVDNNYVYFEITTNNRALLKGLSTDEYVSYHGCFASSVPAFLTAGERVWVKIGRTGSSALWEDASENWNMFSGVLVQT